MAHLLRGKNPNLPNIRQSPDYLKYYAEGMVGNSGAQVPEKYRAEVLTYLIPKLQEIKTDRHLTELLRMSRHTCTRDMIAKNLELQHDKLENTAGYAPDSDEYAGNMDVRKSVMESTAQILADGFYRVEKGKFTFDAKGKINGIIPGEQGRMTACHAALQAGEELDILEEGGRRRVRKRKTVKKSRASRISRRRHGKTRGKA